MRPFHWTIAIALIGLLGWGAPGGAAPPRAVRGELALSGWDFAQGEVRLDGEWEFYWSELLEPADFSAANARTPAAYMNVPGSWGGTETPDGPLPGHGFATYRLRVTGLPSSGGPFALEIPYARTAYRLWANGELIASNGVVSSSPSEMRPRYLPRIATLPSGLNEGEDGGSVVEIVMQVSNAHFRSGGVPRSIVIGPADGIAVNRERRLLTQMFLMGTMALIAIYHGVLFLWRPSDRSTLYFSIFTGILTVRTFVTGDMPLLIVFPGFPWEAHLRIEYLTSYTSPFFFVLFLRSIFPQEVPRIVDWIWGVLAIIGGFTSLVLPVRLTSPFVPGYTAAVGALALYCAFVMVRAAWKRREASGLMLGGGLVFLGAVVLTMLHYNLIWVDLDLLPFGVFALLLSQALTVSRRYALAFRRQTELAHQNAVLLESARHQLEERKRLYQLLVRQDDETRRNIAEMLHGRTQARLFSVWRTAGEAAATAEDNPQEARRMMQAVQTIIDQVREEDIRDASHRLHPAAVRAGLVGALESLADLFEDEITVEFTVDPAVIVLDEAGARRLSENVRLGLYRIAEEALSNVRRHAQADRVRVTLGIKAAAEVGGEHGGGGLVAEPNDELGPKAGDRIELVITDDGVGFDPTQSFPGLGLQLIAARTADLGGEWEIEAAPGAGTTLRVTVPCEVA